MILMSVCNSETQLRDAPSLENSFDVLGTPRESNFQSCSSTSLRLTFRNMLNWKKYCLVCVGLSRERSTRSNSSGMKNRTKNVATSPRNCEKSQGEIVRTISKSRTVLSSRSVVSRYTRRRSSTRWSVGFLNIREGNNVAKSFPAARAHASKLGRLTRLAFDSSDVRQISEKKDGEISIGARTRRASFQIVITSNAANITKSLSFFPCVYLFIFFSFLAAFKCHSRHRDSSSELEVEGEVVIYLLN